MNGSEGGTVTLIKAQGMKANYEASNSYAANNNQSAILYGKDHINMILNQSGCMGIRVYYGREEPENTSNPTMILVGYDANGDDMLDVLVDSGLPCPTSCPKTSKL